VAYLRAPHFRRVITRKIPATGIGVTLRADGDLRGITRHIRASVISMKISARLPPLPKNSTIFYFAIPDIPEGRASSQLHRDAEIAGREEKGESVYVFVSNEMSSVRAMRRENILIMRK
jgi:hypothetical protein